MKTQQILFLSSLFGFYLSSNACQAAIVYSAQLRFTNLGFNSVYGNDSVQFSAPDFGMFDSNLSRTFVIGDASAFATASQRSTLDSSSIKATGRTLGTVGPPVGSSGASGQSHFEVDFTIDQASLYAIGIQSSNAEFGHIRVFGPSIDINRALGLVAGNPAFTLLEDHILQPGSYKAFIEISNSGATEGVVGTYSLDIQQVPEADTLSLLTFVVSFSWLFTFRSQKRSGFYSYQLDDGSSQWIAVSNAGPRGMETAQM